MVKLRDLIKDGMTEEQKADLLPHPKDGGAELTDTLADKVGAPEAIKKATTN